MRNIHPAALIGLLLNFILAYLLFAALLGLDVSGLEPADQELFEALSLAVAEVRPIFYALLAAQAVALGLIGAGIGTGLGLAMAAGFFMLPGSLIYLLGCALSYYNVKYAAFRKAPLNYAGAHFLFPGANMIKTRILTMALLLSAGLCLLTGYATGYNTYDMMFIMLGLALAGAYCMARARRQAALGLYDQHLTLCPALFASPILLPYKDIAGAQLRDDGGIVFDLKGGNGPGRLVWQSTAVLPAQRRQALEELGAALTASGVALR